MVGSALALSLIGLGAVNALPTGKPAARRQWLGDGSTVFIPGNEAELPPCLTEVPLKQQPPCLLPPVVGGLEPSNRKRDAKSSRRSEKRGFWIGDPSSEFIPGNEEQLPTCLTDVPLKQQPPCLLPPIVGPIEPSNKAKRQFWIGDGSSDFIPGNEEQLPTCLVDLPLNQQPPCLLPPIVGPIEPSNKAKRQVIIGDPSSVFIPGNEEELSPCLVDVPLQEQWPCLLAPIVGGIEPSNKAKRQFWIGDGSSEFIPGNEEKLPECLIGVPLKEQPPCLLPPIVGPIEPSSKTKRQFWIGDGSSDFIPGNEEKLPECLLDVPLKQQPPCLLPPIVGPIEPSPKAKRQILIGDGSSVFIPGQGDIPVCLVDVPLNEQPPCILPPIVGGLEPPTLLEPGKLPKRDSFALVDLDAVGTYKDECPDVEGAQLALKVLLEKEKLDVEELIIKKKLEAFLKGCGVSAIISPEGSWTFIKPADKRNLAVSSFDLTGLKAAFEALVSAASLNPNGLPSFNNWLVLQQIAAILDIYGSPVNSTFDVATKRDTNYSEVTKTVAVKSCSIGDIMGLRAALMALLAAYGNPARAPPTVFLAEQVIVAALQVCGEAVQGWITLLPDAAQPGPIVPETPVPGGPIKPDPTVPGGPLEPENPIPGGELEPETPVPGGELEPEKPVPGGEITPENPIPGGEIEPEKPVPGGEITPENPIPGGEIEPEKPVPGGEITPENPIPGCELEPEKPIPGGEITPENPIPGGEITPENPIPGGEIIPENPIPGGELVPSTKAKRDVIVSVSNPEALLETLRILEQAYGGYGSGTIPVPVWLILVNIVSILQSIPGVIVPGWPVLGPGSVVLTPST